MEKPSVKWTALVAALLLVGALALPASAGAREEGASPLSASILVHWIEDALARTLQGLESVWAALGHGIDPNGVEATGCSTDDPTCNPGLGHGIDPDG